MKKKISLAYSSPITAWLTILFVIPTLIVILYSFLEKGLYGGITWNFSLDAYKSFSSPYFIKIFLLVVRTKSRASSYTVDFVGFIRIEC